MTLGDQLSLTWEKIDFQHNLIHVPKAKTGKEYAVPMNQDVRRELQDLKKGAAGNPFVFMNSKTGDRVKEIKWSFGTACRLAKIQPFRWDDLRHTFGTKLGQAGYNAYEIAGLWAMRISRPANAMCTLST
jgi:integrase